MIRRSVVLLTAAGVAAAVSVGSAAARPDAGPDNVALDGSALFQSKGCATCHSGPSSPALVGAGPSLAGADVWAGDRIDGLSAGEYLAESMRSPSAFISPAYVQGQGGPGGGMPLLQLSEAEIDALVTYLLGGSE